MAQLERVRDFMTEPPSEEYFASKASQGYRLVSIEWERGGAAGGPPLEDVPYGLRVASDCRRLEQSPDEMQVLLLMMEGIVKDSPLSNSVETINERGYRTRRGRNGPFRRYLTCCRG